MLIYINFQNIQFLIKRNLEKEFCFSIPIALVENGDYPLLLFETLEGYSNLFSKKRII